MAADRTDTAETLELISFGIGGQKFCMDVRSVREIRGWTPTTPLPQTPDYILGVINLRGIVMPVLDLGHRLGMGQTQPSTRHVIVVIQHGDHLAGLLVDGVQETFQLSASLLQAPPILTCDTHLRFVDAIIPLEGLMLSRLVVEALLPPATVQAEAA